MPSCSERITTGHSFFSKPAFYYRWQVLRKHIVAVEDADVGYVITEFLPKVGWSGAYNTIPAAAGHHIAEASWIRNQAVHKNYTSFWLNNSQANPASYSNWIGTAMWKAFAMHGDESFIVGLRDALASLYRETYVPKYLASYTTAGGESRQCWWQDDDRDAMEVSISGTGCRPTIATFLYGDADALCHMAQLEPANETMQTEFEGWRDWSKKVILEQLWNDALQSFAVIPKVPRPSAI